MPKRVVTNYAEDFKRSSAKLAATSDESISQTAKNLGVNVSTLHGWVQKYSPSVKPEVSLSTEEELSAENKRLRRENRRLQEERDILKKATAYFASETL